MPAACSETEEGGSGDEQVDERLWWRSPLPVGESCAALGARDEPLELLEEASEETEALDELGVVEPVSWRC